ncbi:hypothetical protein BRC81_02580 [Halobacteriales archaeon QS_1_68_20]|nr:MAG: hypothetical protein BRC81_02580 [Halobacteriales archaeon QS_1_68_20]
MNRDDRRGQLMIVMSLVLAVMLVAMALYLNTAIFTENLATRKGDIAGAGGAASYKFAVVDGASSAMTYANYNNNSSSYQDLEDRFEADVANWSDATRRLESARARSANVSVSEIHEGVRINQSENRSFTNESDVEDWTLADGVDGVRNFRMNVTADELGDSWPGNAPHDDPRFSVTFDDGSTVRELQVYGNHSTDNVHVTVLDGAGNKLGTSCTVTNREYATVNVTGATLAGQDCEAMEFFDDLSRPYDVYYRNGSYNVGTYELVVNQSYGTFGANVGHHYAVGDSPYYTRALYSADLEVTYRTARIDYVTVVQIAPGEQE